MPTSLRLSDPAQTAAALDDTLPVEGGGRLILFEDLPDADAVAVCDALAARRDLRFHHIHADTLVQETLEATQGSVREAFDESRGESVLLFTGVGALLDAPLRTDAGEPSEPSPGVRLRRYLFDRAEAFDGIVALCRCAPESPSASPAEPAETGQRRRARAVVVTA